MYRHLELSKTLEYSVCYCYASYEMTDQFFMILGSNEQLQQQLEYTLLKPDCNSCWISIMQSGREDTLEEIYAKEIPQKRMECFSLLFDHLAMNRASVFEWHKRFKEGRESVRDDERCGRSKEVNTAELIGQKLELGLGLISWGFKGVQEEIPSEAASALQIGSVAFPPWQCTSPQLHPCHRLFDQHVHKDSSPSLPIVQTLLPVTFGYSLSSEAVVMR